MSSFFEKSVVLRQMPLPAKTYAVVVNRFKTLYPDSGRRSQRFNYRVSGGIRFTILPASQTETEFIADTVDLSAHGIGLLHAGFVHFQTPCKVELITLDGRKVTVAGAVKRCDCIVAPVHHVGVDFAQPVDITEFIQVVAADAPAAHAAGQPGPTLAALLAELRSEIDQLAELVHKRSDSRVIMLKIRTLRLLVDDAKGQAGEKA